MELALQQLVATMLEEIFKYMEDIAAANGNGGIEHSAMVSLSSALKAKKQADGRQKKF
jgi:hypothetical protein